MFQFIVRYFFLYKADVIMGIVSKVNVVDHRSLVHTPSLSIWHTAVTISQLINVTANFELKNNTQETLYLQLLEK